MQMKSIPWNPELKRGSHLPNLLSYFWSSLKTFVNNTFYSPSHLVHFDMWPAADQIVPWVQRFSDRDFDTAQQETPWSR